MQIFSTVNNFDVKEFFSRFYNRIFEEDILSSAAQVAFYFTFALFPLLLFLFSLFGLVLNSADELRGELFYYLGQVMPASAYTLVNTTIEEVTEESSGGKLTIGLLIALWSASAGVSSIIVALNGVYNLKETRSWWKTKLLSLAITLATSILIMLALGIVLYGTQFVTFILTSLGIPLPSEGLLTVLQFFIILIVLLLSFGLIYNYCPSFEKTNWVWITPGAVTGIILWLLLSAVFRVYLHYFDSYAKTYGSLGAVIILLLWLYLTAVVILIGGLINSIFENMSKQNELTDDNETKAEAQDTNESENINENKPEENENKTAQKNQTDDKKTPETSETTKLVSVGSDLAEKSKISPAENSDKRPVLNLVVGALFGVLFGLFYIKRNH